MSGELFVGIVAVVGFAIGAAIWARCERYVRTGKGIIMVSCIGAASFLFLSMSWVEDLRDNSALAVVAAVVVFGALWAFLGVHYFEGFLHLCRLYRKMKESAKKQRS